MSLPQNSTDEPSAELRNLPDDIILEDDWISIGSVLGLARPLYVSPDSTCLIMVARHPSVKLEDSLKYDGELLGKAVSERDSLALIETTSSFLRSDYDGVPPRTGTCASQSPYLRHPPLIVPLP